MTGAHDEIWEQAAAWHAASFGDDMDWSAFTLWLDADPRHRSAYDEIAIADGLLSDYREELVSAPHAANDDPVRKGSLSWMRWAGAAIAASLLAFVAASQFGAAPTKQYQTGATSLKVALEDGANVTLAPHSRLEVAGRQHYRLLLEGGAWFDVRHNPSRSLAITAAGAEITDIGTQFDVQTADGQLRVEVAQGQVKITSATLSQPVNLAHGSGLILDPEGGLAKIRALSQQDIGEWRSGYLTYDGAPLALVAADLSRYAGVNVTVEEALRNHHFTGTLVIGDGEAALRDLSQLMDVELSGGAGTYRLQQRGSRSARTAPRTD